MNLHRDRHEGPQDVQKEFSKRALGEGFFIAPKSRFTSENEGAAERSKRIKKMFDDLMAIFSLTQTSADASRYRR